MKFFSRIILFMFFFFLSTPTIVSMIERNCDTSMFYNMTEEEQLHKDLKAEIKLADYHIMNLSWKRAAIILSENLSKHDNVFSSIFIPPPELA